MKINYVEFSQKVPCTLPQAWDFFSSPLNLQKITPAHMRFIITSGYAENQKMYPGMIISYKVSPLLGIKMDWLTEITHVAEHKYFIDEQRFGPFSLWHHEHHFEIIEGGVNMTDKLSYAVPFSILGSLANKLIIANNVKQIFDYRTIKIEEIFGKMA